MLSSKALLFCFSCERSANASVWLRLGRRYLIECELQFSTLLRASENEIATGIVHGQIIDEQTRVVHDIEIFQSRTARLGNRCKTLAFAYTGVAR